MPRSGRVPRPPPAPGASTPAHTGPTRCGRPSSATGHLYPRARGADRGRSRPRRAYEPLPPRTRGRRDGLVQDRLLATSTPAHAGPTADGPRPGARRGLYPRARGADDGTQWMLRVNPPLPPRTRGRRPAPCRAEALSASTPAHAGPTRPGVAHVTLISLYPRARGADRARLGMLCICRPLPPRTRGRLGRLFTTFYPPPSTPAHAGPTGGAARTGRRRHLYPRARGADADKPWVAPTDWPLPPRTRGRLPVHAHGYECGASTPAHAGPTLEYR